MSRMLLAYRTVIIVYLCLTYVISAHQTHYEQFGELVGTVSISGVGDREIKVQGVRDHSYGKQ